MEFRIESIKIPLSLPPSTVWAGCPRTGTASGVRTPRVASPAATAGRQRSGAPEPEQTASRCRWSSSSSQGRGSGGGDQQVSMAAAGGRVGTPSPMSGGRAACGVGPAAAQARPEHRRPGRLGRSGLASPTCRQRRVEHCAPVGRRRRQGRHHPPWRLRLASPPASERDGCVGVSD